LHELRSGNCVHVGEGAIVPADGILLSERCRVDESLFSGESAPVIKRRGDRLVAGSVLEDGPVQLELEHIGADTALGGIVALVDHAQAQRPQLQRAGERATSRFVARVLTLTAFTVVAWCLVDPSRAFPAAVAVLVVSCPCAFALAVSAAITRALATLAQRGVLVVRANAIESLAQATHVVFDKTGTLTQSSLTLADVDTFRGVSISEALQLAASLARHSRHPIARVIAASEPLADGSSARNVTVHAGLGISGLVAGRELRLGRRDFALPSDCVPPPDDDALVLADNGGPIAAFHLREQLRSSALTACDALRTQGMALLIASGDSPSHVGAIAARLRITDWRARMSPAQKLAWLNDLRSGGAHVLAVGDGINDAPVLAGADVAIAMAEGAELAQVSSDIVLSNTRLDAIAPARTIARQTLAIVQQNQQWALFYNLTAMPLAALGLVPPWLAAIGMSVSSLGVILNTMRIGRAPEDRAAPPVSSALPQRMRSA
jgi:Cu2+-exporting ATPase